MHETVETTITSRRLSKLIVALYRRRSTSEFIDESFSINVSVCGTYASGW